MNPRTTAFIFPGQGSQFVSMGKELCSEYPEAKEIYYNADKLLGFPLSNLAWEGPESDLTDTINTQPALLIHSIAALTIFYKLFPDFKPLYIAGHSMGEVSALVAAGVVSYPDAVILARTRGKLMKEAGNQHPGGMAAILGLDISILDKICAEASTGNNIVQVANDNCPGQVVISGSSDALTRAMELAHLAGARRIRPLAVSIAAHSPLMIEAQAGFTQAVNSTTMKDPSIPLIGNVNAKPLVSINEVRDDLRAQLTNRVKWTESIQYMIRQGVNTFLELGSGSILSGLVKRIEKEVECYSLGTPEDFKKIV